MSLSLLQDYVSSDDEEPPKKRFPTPNLPKYSVPRSISRKPNENTQKHQYRKRSFPHEPGNWATFVAIKFPVSPEFQDYLDNLLNHFTSLALKPVEDFHISLSRVFVLRHHWINDFIRTLKDNVCILKKFVLTIGGLSTYVNEDKSRTFIALKVEWGNDSLDDIVNMVDLTLAEYSLPMFYSERSFHISLLWGLNDLRTETSQLIESLPDQTKRLSFPMEISDCFCKSGNKYFSMPLA